MFFGIGGCWTIFLHRFSWIEVVALGDDEVYCLAPRGKAEPS